MKKYFVIKGMHCNSCAEGIEDALKDRVEKISVSFSRESAEVEFDPGKISVEEIKKEIKDKGYEVEENLPLQEMPSQKSATEDYVGWIILAVSVSLLFFAIYRLLGNIALPEVIIPDIGDSASLALLFFAGILTGFHCVSMCGAFVVSYTTKNALKGEKSFRQHLIYGASKVFSYAVIGGIFGIIGGIFAFSVGLRGAIAIFAGTFMIFYSLNMMGIKWFRKFQFNPKFLSRVARKKHEGYYRAPFFTGLLSGLFIACGPLQAMYLYAMGSGNFLNGFSSLAAFGLGTLPVMIGFGSIATVISHNTTKRILRISAIIVLVLGIVMLNRGLTVLGSPVSYDALKAKVVVDENSGSAVLVGDYQEINMEVNRYGWEPSSFVLKKGIPVKWNINVKELTGCNNEIIVRSYNLDIKLKKGMNVAEFTPDETGTVQWSCWMGMIPGSFIVTETGQATQEEIAAADPGPAGSCGMGSNGGGCGCGG